MAPRKFDRVIDVEAGPRIRPVVDQDDRCDHSDDDTSNEKPRPKNPFNKGPRRIGRVIAMATIFIGAVVVIMWTIGYIDGILSAAAASQKVSQPAPTVQTAAPSTDLERRVHNLADWAESTQKWMAEARTNINTLSTDRDRLIKENEALKADLAKLTAAPVEPAQQ